MKKYLVIIVIFLLCGCEDYHELNKMGITTAMAIDYNDEKKEFEVTAQIIDIKKSKDTSTSEKAFTTFSSSSSSIQEAIRKITLESSKNLYTPQLHLLIVNKNIINNHLNETLDFFMRNPDIRDELRVILAHDNNIDNLLENISSFSIDEALKTSVKEEGIGTIVTLNELSDMYLNPYREIILPSLFTGEIVSKNDIESNNLKIGNTAIFKDNKFISFLSDDDDKYLSIIKGEINTTVIKMNYKDGYIVFEPNHLEINKKVNIKENKINIIINGFTRVYEINSNIDIEDLNIAKDIEIFFNNNLENKIKASIYKVRNNYNTDIYDFRYLYFKNYSNYDYDKWYNDIFPNLDINITSNIKLYEKGSIKEAIRYEKENK